MTEQPDRLQQHQEGLGVDGGRRQETNSCEAGGAGNDDCALTPVFRAGSSGLQGMLLTARFEQDLLQSFSSLALNAQMLYDIGHDLETCSLLRGEGLLPIIPVSPV